MWFIFCVLNILFWRLSTFPFRVSSTLASLTSLFGMGRGVTLPLSHQNKRFNFFIKTWKNVGRFLSPYLLRGPDRTRTDDRQIKRSAALPPELRRLKRTLFQISIFFCILRFRVVQSNALFVILTVPNRKSGN